MELSKLQEKIVKSPEDKVVVVARAAVGKALENGSIVYTEDGPKQIEDCQVGDKIYGNDGQLTTIVGVFPQGKKRKYIVKFTDGASVNCCDEHLWTFQTEYLRSHKSSKWITASLRDIIDDYKIKIPARGKNNFGSDKGLLRRNIWIPMTEAVDFPKKEVPLDPYTLGALLGDGHFGGFNCQSTFTNADNDIVEKVRQGLDKLGCSLIHSEDSKHPYDYRIKHNIKLGTGRGKFNIILSDLGLDFSKSGTKFIPSIYKYNSVEVRLAVLQGLIDTDGTYNRSAYDIVLKSKQLILDIQEICESLGLTATYSEKRAVCTNSPVGRKDCGIVYRLRIKTSKDFLKLHTSERREKQWKQTKVYAHRAIEEIIETNEYVEMTCIKVDNKDSLFVTNHFIVTHNTTCLTERVRYWLQQGIDPTEICCITFTNLASNEMQVRLANDYKDGMFIGTIHSLAAQFLVKGGYGAKVGSAINEEKFDLFFNYIKKAPSCIEHYSYILVDEAQDLSYDEYSFIFEMIKPEHFFVVGDPFQNIYSSLKEASAKYMCSLFEQPNVIKYDLNENYRNRANILNYAQRALKPLRLHDNSIPMSIGGKIYESKFNIEQVVNWINGTDSYKDWAVLCYSNNDIDYIRDKLDDYDIPTLNFNQRKKTKKEIDDLMSQNKVKVLTVWGAKGLGFPNVIVFGKNWMMTSRKKEAREESSRVDYVAYTRAMNTLIVCK